MRGPFATLALIAVLLPARAAAAAPDPTRCEWCADGAMDACRETRPSGLDWRLANAACAVASLRAYERCMKPDVWRRVVAAQKRPDKAEWVEIVASEAGAAAAAGCGEALDLVAVKPDCAAWGARAVAMLRMSLQERLARPAAQGAR